MTLHEDVTVTLNADAIANILAEHIAKKYGVSKQGLTCAFRVIQDDPGFEVDVCWRMTRVGS